ncbi:TPA: hypothetical protein LR286_003257 [Enterobacter hormaechei]|nr:hypothetical protein [Enterobacter hormaechei]HBL9125589.1 hypothetical protein [Enterobacter hormaechei]HCC6647858.1 hypothetical protein [Enterobacter hormaechei]
MTAGQLTAAIKDKLLEQYGTMYKASKVAGIAQASFTSMIKNPTFTKAMKMAEMYGVTVTIKVK